MPLPSALGLFVPTRPTTLPHVQRLEAGKSLPTAACNILPLLDLFATTLLQVRRVGVHFAGIGRAHFFLTPTDPALLAAAFAMPAALPPAPTHPPTHPNSRTTRT